MVLVLVLGCDIDWRSRSFVGVGDSDRPREISYTLQRVAKSFQQRGRHPRARQRGPGRGGPTVPPTGAKGLNLAFADVRVLFEGVESYATTGSRELLDQYSDRALQRIGKAQNFSYWMTSMLHERPDTNPFERKRQLGELSAVVNSRYGSAYLAEAYTGWPAG